MDCLLECSLTNAYTGCGTSTLNFIERFCLGLVHSASKLNAKCTQMNYEMNCITMHKCTAMYSKWPKFTCKCQSCSSCFALIYILLHLCFVKTGLQYALCFCYAGPHWEKQWQMHRNNATFCSACSYAAAVLTSTQDICINTYVACENGA